MIELYRTSLTDWFVKVAAIGDRWEDEVPSCPKWTVRDLVNHVVGEELWSVPLLMGLTIAQVGHKLEGDLLLDDPMREAFRANEDAYEMTTHPLRALVHTSFGDISGEEYTAQLMADHLIHTWDLARAIKVPNTMNPRVMNAVSLWFTPEKEAQYLDGGAISSALNVPKMSGPQGPLLRRFGRAQ